MSLSQPFIENHSSISLKPLMLHLMQQTGHSRVILDFFVYLTEDSCLLQHFIVAFVNGDDFELNQHSITFKVENTV